MAEIKPSDIVQSLAGHDKSEVFFVLRTEETFAYVADGKNRKCSKPKRKNLKHLARVAESDSQVAQRIRRGESVADSEVRKALAPYRAASRKAKGGK